RPPRRPAGPTGRSASRRPVLAIRLPARRAAHLAGHAVAVTALGRDPLDQAGVRDHLLEVRVAHLDAADLGPHVLELGERAEGRDVEPHGAAKLAAPEVARLLD